MLPSWLVKQSTSASYLLENINISHDGENFRVQATKIIPEEFLLGAAVNQNKRVYL